MARILTGVQSTNIPHLGNILGAIIPALELSGQAGNDSLFFIADLHSLTTIMMNMLKWISIIPLPAQICISLVKCSKYVLQLSMSLLMDMFTANTDIIINQVVSNCQSGIVVTKDFQLFFGLF